MPSKIVSLDGPPCPRCGCVTEIREHERITERELALAFYYSRWYNCGNRNCRTNVIMPPEFRVSNEHSAPRQHDVVTTPTKDSDGAEPEVRYISSDKPALPPIKSDAVFVNNGFKASLCLECGQIDLIPASEGHKPCTVCGAEHRLT
jgi:hypothetical protein